MAGSTVELTDATLRTPTELTSVGFTDTGLVAGTTYAYVVVAVDRSANPSAASAVARATAVQPTIPPHDLLVDPSGADGAHTTVQAAVTAAGAGTAARPKVIAIMPGTYRETVSLENPYVTLVGATGDARDVVIVEDNGATTINPATGAAYGGSGSRTVYVKAGNITMRDLTIANDFDESTGGDQTATALFTEGDRLVFDGVRVLGNKNTLQVSTRSGTDASVLGRVYVVDSYLEGDVDTVYGRGTAVLDRTEVHITDRVSTPYVLAPRTFAAHAYGFLLTDSTVTSSKALYLGRPWNPDATFAGQALVRDTVLPATVRTTPWRASSGGLDWKTSARFAEHNNSGAGAGTAGADRPMLSAAEAAGVTKWDYLEGTDGWNPTGQAAPDAGDVEAPDAPASVVADFDESSTSTVALSWSPSRAADTKGYLVYRGFERDGEVWSQLTPQPVTGTSFTDVSAGRGLTTFYRVVAVDFVGNASAVATTSVQVPVGALDEEISVFVAGDSTAADYDLDRAPRAGWGQALPLYLDEDVTVRNFAQSGRSTKTFMAEGWLDKIWAEIEPGDYLLVSFAHNDEDDDPAKFVPLGSVTTPGTFQYNLQLFIDGARARGAHPVVVASVERRKFASVNGVETGPALVTHKGYPEAAIALASSQDVPVVNLTQASLARFTELGPVVTKQWFMHLPVGSANYPDGQVDNTHFQATGAIGVARMVARGLDASGAWPAGVHTRNLDQEVPVSELRWLP